MLIEKEQEEWKSDRQEEILVKKQNCGKESKQMVDGTKSELQCSKGRIYRKVKR